MMWSRSSLLLLFWCGLCLNGWANNPGKHNISYTWSDPTCDANFATCSYSLYFGTVTGVCGDGKTPTNTGIVGAAFNTPTLPAGTYFAAVTAVDLTTGGESTCSAEVQSTVPPITTKQATQMSGKVN